MITLEGPPARVLTAYTHLLVERGIRGATLEAVARRAGLSKSGALHHFASVGALNAALFVELRAQARHDAEAMRRAPEGSVRYYLVSSLDRDSELERVIEAGYRIAQTGDEAALEVLRACRRDWLEVLAADTGDASLARMVLFAGDGVNHNALMNLPAGEEDVLTPEHVESLIVAFEQMPSRRTSTAAE
ncbi:TetR/AcrR family transcriptional regulator [Agromyces sp. Marseille-Q5079]|uniref:TetR/AcrR family transcriptional regulator n=1 Tax=Agromyces sp. Marseille-Q5079 TaxID=3439059 RepID=UPI003D9C9666